MFRVCCMTRVLLREIANPESRKRDVALSYYLAMRDDPDTDWGQVIDAIKARWGWRGVLQIQRRARIRAYGVREEIRRSLSEACFCLWGWALSALEWVRGKAGRP